MCIKVMLLLLAGCLVFGAKGEDDNLKDVIDILFSRDRKIELDPEQTIAKLKLASQMVPAIGDTEQTIDKWQLTKNLLPTLESNMEDKCGDKSLRDEYGQLVHNNYLKPEYETGSVGHTDYTREKVSNTYLCVRHYHYAVESFCEMLLYGRVVEAINSYSPEDKKKIEEFYEAIKRHQKEPEDIMIAKASLSLMTSRVDLSKQPKLNRAEEIDRFDSIYSQVIIDPCKTIQEKIGQDAETYRKGQVYVLRKVIEIRTWLEVQRVCTLIQSNVQPYLEMTYELLKKRSRLSSICKSRLPAVSHAIKRLF